MNKISTFLWSISLLLSLGMTVNANQLDAEIDYLLNEISTTECTFNRNGSRHQGTEAVAHIQRKYDYYEDDIGTAEDFIRLSASKSTVTRRVYTIECPGVEPIQSQQWLLLRLAEFRAAQ